MVWSRDSSKKGPSLDPGIAAPATVAASTPTAPTSEASTTRPLRNRYMYQPTNSAIGIVQAMVNVPHELPGTSRVAPLGSVKPPPGLLLSLAPAGTARRNDSWNVIS